MTPRLILFLSKYLFLFLTDPDFQARSIDLNFILSSQTDKTTARMPASVK